MLRLEDMHRSGGYSSTKTATIPAATFQTPVRFGTPDTPPHNASPYPIINPQLSNPPSPGPGRAYSNRTATLNYPAPQPIDPIFPHIEDATPLVSSPHRSAPVEPGVYEIKNDVLGVSIDFNEVDRKSVVGYQYHGKANQQASPDLDNGVKSQLNTVTTPVGISTSGKGLDYQKCSQRALPDNREGNWGWSSDCRKRIPRCMECAD